MKALAILIACLVVAAPARAFAHMAGGHSGAPRGHGHGHGHGGFGLGPWGGVDFPDSSAPDEVSGPSGPFYAPPFGMIAASAVALPGPAPYRPSFAPPRPRPGPHIIYIGHQPTIHGPKVIYGVN